MKNIKGFLLIAIFSLLIFLITGCSKDNTNLNMESKIEAEIEFCENRIILFLKNCEYDEYVKDDILNWENIKDDTDKFVNSFPTIEADLSNVQYDQNKIEEIKTNLQNISNYSQTEDFEKLQNEYGNLYLKIISIKNSKNKDFKNKCMQIYIQALTENKNFESLVTDLENTYSNLKQDSEFIQINKYSLNKINDNILDLKNAIQNSNFKKIRAHSLKIIEIM